MGTEAREVYGKTKKEAQAKMIAKQKEIDAGALVIERQTVEEFMHRWMRDVIEVRNKPRTIRTYRYVVEQHIVPQVGRLPLSKLTAEHVQRILANASRQDLSPRTVAFIRNVLKTALAQAKTWHLVVENVAALVEPPRVERYEATVLTPDEARRLLAATEGEPLAPLFHLALLLGLRQGELLGLRWSDVDLDGRTLKVEQTASVTGGKVVIGTPKTAGSRRTVPLTATLVALLRQHRIDQLKQRWDAGKAWEDYDLVFPAQTGRPLNQSMVRKTLERSLERAGLPHIRFHDLRHACASLLASEGVPLTIVAAILGHSGTRMTQHYSRAYETGVREAIEALEKVLHG